MKKISINKSFYQRCENVLCWKLNGITIKPQTHTALQCKLDEINIHKKTISEIVGWYLDNKEKFNVKLDLDRKCRALGIPPYLTGINIHNKDLENVIDTLDKQLKPYTDQNRKLSKYIIHDINELVIYAKMYQEVEVGTKMYPTLFTKGNPFADIIDLVNLGAVIIRFKYVKSQNKTPIEKLITYHLWSKKRLLIHIEGENNFVGWKYWGEGDETIQYFMESYHIRWGLNDFEKRGKFRY